VLERKPLAGARHDNSATLLLAHDCCFNLLNLSFAVRVSEPVTPIFVPPVEMPAPCHVRLGETTLKPSESVAVCRTRLSLPYVLEVLHCSDNTHPSLAFPSDFPNFGGRQMGLIWEKATRHVRSLNIGGRLCPCRNPTWATMKTEIRLRAAKTIAKLA
jgi:hypothetical protein